MISSGAKKNDYLAVVYDEQDKPFTRYPDLLAKYLVARYNLVKGQKILDLGCGRGEFLRGFIRCGLKGYGVDESSSAQSICPEAEILQADLEKYQLPYEDNGFDIVFSKSVLEHFYYPEKLVKEIYRVLKPGGLAITMTPDWRFIHKNKMFYDDYTHRTPFTLISLERILKINGFENVKVIRFKQLPFLWKRPWLSPLSAIISLVMPRKLSPYSKLIKFSKAIMLLANATKPKEIRAGQPR